MSRRIAAGRPCTLSRQFYDDEGVATDPGTTTVAVTRDNGDAQSVAASVAGTTANPRTVALTAAEVGTDADLFTVTWTTTNLGTQSETVEIVGDWIVPLGSLRTELPSPNFTVDRLRRGRDWFEELAEDHCGVAFRPRYRRHTFIGDGTANVILPDMFPREIAYATLAGTALTTTLWDLHDSGEVCADQTFTRGDQVVIGYRYGHDHPPADLVDVGILAALDSIKNDNRRASRQLSETDQFGNTQRDSIASERYPTGIPAVDSVLNRLREI